jgi:hypothetical protein
MPSRYRAGGASVGKSSFLFVLAAIVLSSLIVSQAIPQAAQPKTREKQSSSGIVRDERGDPVAGADVFVLKNHLGIRHYQEVLATKTDAEGRWTMEDGLGCGDIVASKEGRPAGYMPLTPSSEIVIPDRGGRLEVKLRAMGGRVPEKLRVIREGGPMLFTGPYAGAPRGPEAERLATVLTPTAGLNDDGLYVFKHLTPGLYRIEALWSPDPLPDGTPVYSAFPEVSVLAEGVAVRPEETRKFHAKVLSGAGGKFQVVHVDGKSAGNLVETVEYTSDSSNTTAKIDKDGVGEHPLYRREIRGLRHISIRYLDQPLSRLPISEPTYYEAEAVISVSSLLSDLQPTVLRATAVNWGSLVVRVEDAGGKRVRCEVVCDEFPGQRASRSGNTDERGESRFTGFGGGEHTVTVHGGASLPVLGRDGKDMPADEVLIGRSKFVQESVKTAMNRETQITIKPKPVGYVRGIIKPAAGHHTEEYKVIGWIQFGLEVNYDPRSGEFVAGPYQVGKVPLGVSIVTPGDLHHPISQTVDVASDRVIRVELTAPDKPASQEDPALVSLGYRDADRRSGIARTLAGKVYLPDGKTPASGAAVAVLQKDWERPSLVGLADARGAMTIEYQGFPQHTLSFSRELHTTMPAEAVLVVWLPGSHGETVVPIAGLRPYPTEFKVVLPHPLSIRGKVSVGGKSTLDRDGELRVFAAYDGDARSEKQVAGIRCTPEADGTYELRGLTPGTYHIQAALDGIWVSETRKVMVQATDGPKALELNLDIGEPGPPSTIELVDDQGKPRPALEVALHRPAGPLTRQLWPDRLTADPAGVVNIPPLEAGEHRITVGGSDHRLTVPSLAGRKESVRFKLTVSPGSPKK